MFLGGIRRADMSLRRRRDDSHPDDASISSRTRSKSLQVSDGAPSAPNGAQMTTSKTVGEHSNKLKSFRVRLYSTIVLIFSFVSIIYAGHVPLMGMVLAIQTIMVKELFQLAREAQTERTLPGFRAQQWYFYFVAAFWVYVRFIKNNLMVEITSSAALSRLLGTMIRRHTFISYSL